jgi:hypothetical protein
MRSRNGRGRLILALVGAGTEVAGHHVGACVESSTLTVCFRGLERADRVLVAAEPPGPLAYGAERRWVSGGLLMQQRDRLDAPGDHPVNWTLAAGAAAAPATLANLVFVTTR